MKVILKPKFRFAVSEYKQQYLRLNVIGSLCFLFICTAIMYLCRINKIGEEKRRVDFILMSPELIDLGNLPSGCSLRYNFKVSNASKCDLFIKALQTSCDCLGIDSESVLISSGSDTIIRLLFDTSKEPSFRGDLSMWIQGVTPENEVAFRSIVRE